MGYLRALKIYIEFILVVQWNHLPLVPPTNEVGYRFNPWSGKTLICPGAKTLDA